MNREQALEIFEHGWKEVLMSIENLKVKEIFSTLEKFAEDLSNIKLKRPLDKAKTISLIGEIFVRKDEASRLDIVERLAEKGFVVNRY